MKKINLLITIIFIIQGCSQNVTTIESANKKIGFEIEEGNKREGVSEVPKVAEDLATADGAAPLRTDASQLAGAPAGSRTPYCQRADAGGLRQPSS